MRINATTFIDCSGPFKPGDPPPEGYTAWHEWADVQRKAGIQQVQCGSCGLWRTPQELSGKAVQRVNPVCKKCEEVES